MDAQSIITQVNRDDENASTNSRLDKVPETKTPPTKSSHGIFSRLFCCFRPAVTQASSSTNNILSNSLKKSDANNNFILPPVSEAYKDKKCVVIDLDETLVHSSFQPVKNADFIIPVEIDGTIHQVYILKRPYVDEFLKQMGSLFECVLFTASLGKYADPVTDLLDKWNVFQARLFRESCVFHRGNYVKDLGRLGRDLNKIIIIDNSPMSYFFHPKNAVPVTSWFDDPTDRELLNLIPFFENLASADDIYNFLSQSRHSANFSSASFRTIEAVSLVGQQAPLVNQQPTFHPTSNEDIVPLNDTFSPAPVVVDELGVVVVPQNIVGGSGGICNGDIIVNVAGCGDDVDNIPSDEHQQQPINNKNSEDLIQHKGDGDQQQQVKQQPTKQQQQQNKAIIRLQQHTLPQPVRVPMQQQSSLQNPLTTTNNTNKTHFTHQQRSSSLNRQHFSNNNSNNINNKTTKLSQHTTNSCLPATKSAVLLQHSSITQQLHTNATTLLQPKQQQLSSTTTTTSSQHQQRPLSHQNVTIHQLQRHSSPSSRHSLHKHDQQNHHHHQ